MKPGDRPDYDREWSSSVPVPRDRSFEMPVEAAFVDAIRETPDDWTLRLVYADWLDEAGDSRGELIRLQCEHDALPPADPRRNVLRDSINRLILRFQSQWLAPLRKRVLGWQQARFDFGLVENVAMSPTAFIKHAETGLFEEMPHLVGVWLQGAEKSLLKALASPYLSELTSLTLSAFGCLKQEPLLDGMAKATAVRNLTSLNLGNGRYGDAGIARLLRSPYFPRLRRLNLQNNYLTSRTAKELVDSPILPQLKLLALGSRWQYGTNGLGDAGARLLAESRVKLSLRWLDLMGNQLGDSSAWDLAKSSCFEHLEGLYLGGNRFGRASRTATRGPVSQPGAFRGLRTRTRLPLRIVREITERNGASHRLVEREKPAASHPEGSRRLKK